MSKTMVAVLIALAVVSTLTRHLLRDAPNPKSIAVLPFVDLSPAHDQEYFTDGVSDEIVNRLATMGVKVAPRESTFAFKGQRADMSEVARALNVDAVLAGSINRDGNRVRATMTLYGTARNSVIWSATFDRSSANAFALQDELSSSAAEPINTALAR